ncbi:hypothetical protein E2C01_028086 [Portunus trituberculatus]|uniref:Uncharacterized protein n=1 Tax=Portunus trituberculatus TaxID=210409 RepID=A0A5B7EMZ1_PORTR|nr:hypothetical protein [Portunus trituberculatus]
MLFKRFCTLRLADTTGLPGRTAMPPGYTFLPIGRATLGIDIRGAGGLILAALIRDGLGGLPRRGRAADVIAGLTGVLVKTGATAAGALDPTTDKGTVVGGVCGDMWVRATRGVVVAGVVVVRAGRPLPLDSCTAPAPQLMMLVCVTDELGFVSVDREALTGTSPLATTSPFVESCHGVLTAGITLLSGWEGWSFATLQGGAPGSVLTTALLPDGLTLFRVVGKTETVYMRRRGASSVHLYMYTTSSNVHSPIRQSPPCMISTCGRHEENGYDCDVMKLRTIRQNFIARQKRYGSYEPSDRTGEDNETKNLELLLLLAIADLEGLDQVWVHEALRGAWRRRDVLQRQGNLVIDVEEMASFPKALLGLVSTCNDATTTCYLPKTPEARSPSLSPNTTLSPANLTSFRVLLVEVVAPLHFGVEEARNQFEHHVLQRAVLAEGQQGLRLVHLRTTDTHRSVYTTLHSIETQ